MDVIRRSQGTMYPRSLTVETPTGAHVAFDSARIHQDLTSLTNDPTVVHRVESLIVAQLAGFDVVATETIEATITATLEQLGYTQMARQYQR
ncbi:hypothetical protein LNA02_20940 [Levilactobacillus namurensis]|uniref:hypothetical protein n=1 Tax=Levilactobacillus namurensis TaxID=380393 RepID=UPI00046700B9|nr:hypothetical protein [Levilactobacillus namurensis]PTM23013.1 hypothetical protein DA798_05280 [Lactobacillus sp. PFC-70]MCW3778671.1 hypothetical protein [Levilactobacillus namurensis]MDT7019615.1 hypothetical protein [Levilactobacillus namurensis]WNN65801.1 hypothetical protein RIN67_01530 [Levilactobacillus namurensis]GEO75396.1 hypothetical protein LNA02_20940 [Levilactobacillus namurensis]